MARNMVKRPGSMIRAEASADLGAGVAVDFERERDFDDARGLPSHEDIPSQRVSGGVPDHTNMAADARPIKSQDQADCWTRPDAGRKALP